LILKRNPLVFQGNTWGLVGGKVERNEEPIDSVQREVGEEVGLNIPKKDFKYIDRQNLYYHNMTAECYIFKALVPHVFEPKLQIEEAIDFKWTSYKDFYNMNNIMEGLRELLDWEKKQKQK
jgi:8-oxo-dGTP pyrophosphatase MutT (NUDIX family)